MVNPSPFFRTQTKLQAPRLSAFRALVAHGCRGFAACLGLTCGLLTAASADQVTLQLKWKHQFQFAGYYAALEQGYYREAGLEVRLVEADPAIDPVKEVTEGRAQYGVSNSALVLARHEGRPVVVLAAIFQHSPLVLMARAEAGITSIHDLVGKRVMIERHSDELLAYLRKEGVPLESLNLQNHTFGESDLVDGKVDAVSAYSSDESFLLGRSGLPFLTFTPRTAGIDFYGDNLFTTEHELRSHPARVKAFREASMRGWKYAVQHPEEMIDLILARYGARHSREHLRFEARQTALLMAPEVVEVGYMHEGRWRHIAETYADLGLLPRTYSLAGFLYDPEAANRASRRRLKLALTVVLPIAVLLGILALAFLRLNRRLTRSIQAQLELDAVLRENERKFRFITEHAADVIWIMDLATGKFTYVSPSVFQLRGFTPEEILSQPALAALSPASAERVRMVLAESIEAWSAGRPVAPRLTEVDQPHKNGHLVPTEVVTTLHADAEGQLVSVLGVSRDITLRKREEAEKAELEARTRQLRKAESLSRMAGAIAHHFNNQLQAVMANLEMLGALPGDLDPHSRLDLAKQGIDRAAEVSRLMLVYLGQIPTEQEPQLLSDCCSACLPVLQGTLPRNVVLAVDFPSPGPVIKANAAQLQQALSCLITNAWEAIGEAGGNISIRIGTCPAAAIPTTRRYPLDWQPREADYAWLEVADTGSGVAEAHLENLFDPFFSTKFTGRGLGLAVVLGIVQSHGAAVTVETMEGQGTTFRIHFPLFAGGLPRLPEKETPAGDLVVGGVILLVDDDEFVLWSTGAMIEKMGFEVVTALDGVDAVTVFQQHQERIRCVITDLTMPRMDGWETLAALHQLAPTVPVILSSGYDKAQAMAGEHPVKPRGFLAKPYRLEQLRHALAQAMKANPNPGF